MNFGQFQLGLTEQVRGRGDIPHGPPREGVLVLFANWPRSTGGVVRRDVALLAHDWWEPVQHASGGRLVLSIE